jgi:hypothetical protein
MSKINNTRGKKKLSLSATKSGHSASGSLSFAVVGRKGEPKQNVSLDHHQNRSNHASGQNSCIQDNVRLYHKTGKARARPEGMYHVDRNAAEAMEMTPKSPEAAPGFATSAKNYADRSAIARVLAQRDREDRMRIANKMQIVKAKVLAPLDGSLSVSGKASSCARSSSSLHSEVQLKLQSERELARVEADAVVEAALARARKARRRAVARERNVATRKAAKAAASDRGYRRRTARTLSRRRSPSQVAAKTSATNERIMQKLPTYALVSVPVYRRGK